jgi:hypothetical protein
MQPNFCATFPVGKNYVLILTKKWFGQMVRKLTWSSFLGCCQTRFSLAILIMYVELRCLLFKSSGESLQEGPNWTGQPSKV